MNKDDAFNIRRFVFVYVTLMFLFFLLMGLNVIKNVFDVNKVYNEIIVIMTSKVLYLLNIPSSCNGSILRLSTFAMEVKFGCSGLESVMIYSIAIVAYPATWMQRLVGIVTGFFIIQLLNIIRIVALGLTGIYFKEIFDVVHFYVAQGIMIAISLALFFMFSSYVAKNRLLSK
ncbi:archaeosortase/exosortase family protein [Candidatus Magnetobacterium casense]|uniref:Archaeosortase/exosortase family protein n=1 Tax=Candidatus Magnetobacterium casense TaxID=1455061 RepID=A0ABS6RV03_9BACT|nr:archaeosortase/exosortase family protein [Candidatus Magnetobacterium casensis]MBV6340460.1 archaeosortase/exosortase family protein [Candidatus Magnetobacterium casensis]